MCWRWACTRTGDSARAAGMHQRPRSRGISAVPPSTPTLAGAVRRTRAGGSKRAIREFEFAQAPVRPPQRIVHTRAPARPLGLVRLCILQAPGVRAAQRTRAGYCLTSPSVYYIYEPQRARAAPHTAPPAASAQPRHTKKHTHTSTRPRARPLLLHAAAPAP
jgi:hypothetical protein